MVLAGLGVSALRAYPLCWDRDHHTQRVKVGGGHGAIQLGGGGQTTGIHWDQECWIPIGRAKNACFPLGERGGVILYNEPI